MKILIDETGKFELKTKNDFALTTLVSIPSSEEEPLLELLAVIQKEYPQGEIKGTNIRFSDRVKVFTHLKKSPYAKYSLAMMSGFLSSGVGVLSFKKAQIEKLSKSIDLPRKIGNTSLVKDLELLRNQINNLSRSDFTKFIMTVTLIIEWQRVALFDYLNYSQDKENWNFEFVLDSLNKPEKMKRLVKDFIHLTTNIRNPNYGVFLPKEWQPKHKFISKYDTKEGLNAKKIFENLGFYTEEEKPLLTIPDLIGNTFFRAVNDPNNVALIELIKMLDKNRSLYLTSKNKRNYFVPTGFDGTRTRRKPHNNIRLLYKNLNYSPLHIPFV